jgi:sensor domain CHASE-containing protein
MTRSLSIRTKTLLIVAATLVGLIGGVYVLSRAIIVDGFTEIENDAVEENVRRAEDALAQDIAAINTTAGDWAYWDDTYQFAMDGNQA